MNLQSTPLAELVRQRDQVLGAKIAELQAQQGIINAEIRRRYEEKVRAVFAREDKQYGTVNLIGEDGLPIKGEIGKKVKWDSNALMSVAREMPWEEVQRTFKIKFEIPEKTYKALDEEFRAKVDAARTTEYGGLSISVAVKGDKP